MYSNPKKILCRLYCEFKVSSLNECPPVDHGDSIVSNEERFLDSEGDNTLMLQKNNIKIND